MSYSLPSAEVAADFKDALQDLRTNSRPEISNLTIIAKENTEHAQAISRELETHIQTTRPEWKLPALYVLDSIVKNVGTPYTVYLSRNLYKTFMNAYTLMDMPTRKAMEGLLKTWKQSVPESMDTRPVFPVEVTREIENALIKYKTITIQHQQQQPRPNSAQPIASRPFQTEPWRNTPTPPQNGPFYPAPNDPRTKQVTPQQSFPPYPQPGMGSSTPNQGINGHSVAVPVDLNKVLTDLSNVIEATQAQLMTDVNNANLQRKLQILQALQMRLKSGDVPPAQLKAVQDQITGLTATPSGTPSLPSSRPIPFVATARPSMSPFPHMATPPQPRIPSPSPAQPPFAAPLLANLGQPPVSSIPSVPLNLADLLRQGIPSAAPKPAPSPAPAAPPVSANLADILRQFQKPTTNSTPVLSAPTQPPPPTPHSVPNSLLEALRAQNLLPKSAPTNPPFIASSGTPLAFPSANLEQTFAFSGSRGNDVELTTASITKRPRLHLIERLYGSMPNQCTTCGRRFPNTTTGKEMKARHMDWHFKVKDPDIAKRGIHRSWYISEREWIAFREEDDALPSSAANATMSGGVGREGPQRKPAKERWIPVPTEQHLVNAPCPICQERFDPQWSVDANDFVWMDAVKVNGRIYHATCWEEINRGSGAERLRSATPDSVLGKRKAENNQFEPAKIKLR